MSKQFWESIRGKSNEELTKVMGLDFTWRSTDLLTVLLDGLTSEGFKFARGGVSLIVNPENKRESAFQVTATKNNYDIVMSVVNSHTEVFLQAGPINVEGWAHQVKYTYKNLRSLPNLLTHIINEAGIK
jgi:hypothetical protein